MMRIWTIILFLAFAVSAQTKEQVLNQQLNKALDVVEAQDKLILAMKSEIEALHRSEGLAIELADARKTQLTAKNLEIEQKDAQIFALRKISCDTTSFLFGLIKSKKCR